MYDGCSSNAECQVCVVMLYSITRAINTIILYYRHALKHNYYITGWAAVFPILHEIERLLTVAHSVDRVQYTLYTIYIGTYAIEGAMIRTKRERNIKKTNNCVFPPNSTYIMVIITICPPHTRKNTTRGAYV